MAINDSFYQNIPQSSCMADVFNSEFSHAVPAHWLLLMTDVVQSTKAIESGLYRDVNVAGGLAVMAIANLLQSLDFPFIFGGDGVTMLIPNDLEKPAREVLIDTQEKIKTIFNLELRIGIIPMQELYKHGYHLRVAKLRFSAQYTQAILDGDALDVAEMWLKTNKLNNPFLITSKQNNSTIADFSGFICRWQDIPSAKGEIVALIVKFRRQNNNERQEQLRALLAFLNEHYGTEKDYHPIQSEQMHAGGFKLLWREIYIRSAERSLKERLNIAIKTSLQVAMIRFVQLFKIPMKIAWIDLLKLKELNAISADFRKFDGSLKMIISGTYDNRLKLNAYLESNYQQEKLFYGLHVSSSALLTCLMHFESSGEVHFVDGTEGGYAMAAKQLKAQLAKERI